MTAKSIGTINLARGPHEPRLRVDFERFLEFSYEIAESLQDIVAKYRHESVPVLPVPIRQWDCLESSSR